MMNLGCDYNLYFGGGVLLGKTRCLDDTPGGQRMKIMQIISLSHSSMFIVFPANKSGLWALSLEIIDRLLCIA